MDYSLAPVTLQQIMIFLEVVDCNSFSKAGTYLHMTQSAVSKSIQKLEQNLGFSLFSRTTRELRLTEAGELLSREWRVSLQAIDSSYRKAFSLAEGKNNFLYIGLLNTVRPDLYFWDLEKRFRAAWPEIEINLETEYMTDLIEHLSAGIYDVIMVPDFERYSLAQYKLSWKWAARSNCVLCVPKTHPLSDRDTIYMEEALDCKIVVLNNKQNSNFLKDLSERYAEYNAVPNTGYSFKNAYDLKYLYRPDNGCFFMDAYFDLPPDPDMKMIRIKDQFNGIICGYNPANKNPSLQKFLNILPKYENI